MVLWRMIIEKYDSILSPFTIGFKHGKLDIITKRSFFDKFIKIG